MRREHRVLSRLWACFDRAPRAFLFCDDHDVIGADFVIMERRTGEVVRGEVPASMADHTDVGRRLGLALVDAMARCLKAEDPGARAVPYMLSGGTDAKSFSRLGMRCFGFSPLRLPADLDFSGMFHGVDERVPLDSLKFGVRVLDRFLDEC